MWCLVRLLVLLGLQIKINHWIPQHSLTPPEASGSLIADFCPALTTPIMSSLIPILISVPVAIVLIVRVRAVVATLVHGLIDVV